VSSAHIVQLWKPASCEITKPPKAWNYRQDSCGFETGLIQKSSVVWDWANYIAYAK